MKIYLFTTLNWVNEHENSKLNKFSQSIGQYIFHSYYQTNLLSLKLQFIRPNQHFLLEFSNFNSTLQSKVCSKLAIEIADVLLSLLLILNCWLWTCHFRMEYFIALIWIYLYISESDLSSVILRKMFFCHKDLYLRCCIRFELKILIYLIHKISKRFCGVEGGHSPWSSAILWEYEKLTLLDALKIHFQRFFTLAFLHIISNRLNQRLKFASVVGKCWGFY